MLGQMIGSYRVTALLGEGGMGRVYIGEHALIGRKAAIKVLLPEYTTKAEIVDRFFNEARALAGLKHPGLVDVLDFGHHADGSAFLVMELLEGESLAARLRRERQLDLGLAIEIARQVALAVGAAHRKKIIHRDLKPENIFLVPDEELACGLRAKILDFGIAKLAGEAAVGGVRTRTDVIMGTPAYMSPEQCRGASLVDQRGDVYSLGCILFEMCCGRTPFQANAAIEMCLAHVMNPPPSPRALRPEVPPELEAITLRTLEKEPEARFESMGQLAAALERVEAAVPAAAREIRSKRALDGAAESSPPAAVQTTLRATAAEMTRPDVRRSRWRMPVASGVVAVVCVAGVAWMWPGKKSPVVAPAPVVLPEVPPPVAKEAAPPRVDPPPPEPAAHGPVRLRVESKPPGAEVVRQSDGAVVGVTPAVVEQSWNEKSVEFRLRLKGHRDGRVVWNTRADAVKMVELKKERETENPFE